MDSNELSPEAIRMLDAILASAPTTHRPEIPRARIAEFVLGRVPEAEREPIIWALTHRPDLRQTMVEMRQQLAASVLVDPDLKEIVTRCTLASIEETRAIGPRSGWLEQARQGSEVLLSLFRDLGLRLSNPQLQGFAVSRGTESVPVAGTSLTAQLSASVTEDDLRLVASLSAEAPKGTVIHALFEDPELGTLEIGSAPPAARFWELTVPGAGSTLGLESAEISTHAIRLSVRPNGASERVSWRAEFEDEPDRLPVWIAGAGQPWIAGGILRVPVALSEEMAASLSGYQASLFVRVLPRRLPLVTTPVAELVTKGAFECEIDAPDGPVPPEAFIVSLRGG